MRDTPNTRALSIVRTYCMAYKSVRGEFAENQSTPNRLLIPNAALSSAREWVSRYHATSSSPDLARSSTFIAPVLI